MLLFSYFEDGTVIQSEAYRHAIKEVSKFVNLDWIHNQACSLSQNIYVITNLFITNNYLFEMINVNPKMRPRYLRRWPDLTEVLKGKYD